MVARLNPYLNFPGNAREAMEFYQKVFGGTLHISTFGQYGMEGPAADQVMHAMLAGDHEFALMASDTPPGMSVESGSSITISLSGDESELLHGYWEQLSSGGTVTTPLAKQMWGDEFGQCTDAYGVGWLVNISQPS